jgi:cysteine-rich repeat protein
VRFAGDCGSVTVAWRRATKRWTRFSALRSRCGDGTADRHGFEACDDGNAADCDGCAADCSAATAGCVAAASCAAYARQGLPAATCSDVDASRPGRPRHLRPDHRLGGWTVDAAGLPATT